MVFLVDAQLPPALAQWLAERGHAAAHVMDVQLERADDAAIWEYALRTGGVILTKDEDFAKRRMVTTAGPAIVWIRIGNTANPELLRQMEQHLAHIVSALLQGEPLIEVS